MAMTSRKIVPMPGTTLLTSLLLLSAPAASDAASPGVVLVQEGGIKAQDPATADKGQVGTGWVQAPVPRDASAPQQPAQGHGAAPIGAHPGEEGGQKSPGANPGTVVDNPRPGPGGIASGK